MRQKEMWMEFCMRVLKTTLYSSSSQSGGCESLLEEGGGVIGAALFMYKDGKTSGDGGESLVGFGEFLLILSLTMDGLTGAIQERMRSEHQTKSGHMMLNMNLWSILYMGVALFLTVSYSVTQYFSSHPPVYEKDTKSFVWNCVLHSASDMVFDCCAHAHIGGGGEEGGTAMQREHCCSGSARFGVMKTLTMALHPQEISSVTSRVGFAGAASRGIAGDKDKQMRWVER
uniref:Uncharacterized protein n=1 Tax=Timema douglasi TaxID=61478 RepID=A0A7R8Z945_TIMDO|nr:unnamed protein product [Timema douglasi]